MTFALHDVSLPGGDCPVHMFGRISDPNIPLLLLFMDGFGPRPVLFEVAERFAAQGYAVLLPQLFYRFLPFDPFDPPNVTVGDADYIRLMAMFGAIRQPDIDADVRALLSYAQKDGADRPMACVGYCMGGRYALTAATADRRVRFAASIHGAMLAPDDPASPHHRFDTVAARIYIGIAGIDAMFEGEEEGRLAAALRTAGTNHMIETYPGAHHGFVMPDIAAYDAPSAEHHWRRLLGEMDACFSSSDPDPAA